MTSNQSLPSSEKENKITICVSGDPGSGKSTACKPVAIELGLDYVNFGSIFRGLAKEKGMDFIAFNNYVVNHPDIDRELEKRQIDAIKKGNVVLEGRLSTYAAIQANIPAFKIYLATNKETQAKRLQERDGGTIKKTAEEALWRHNLLVEKFKKLYGFDFTDHNHYDLVIDTSNMSRTETVDKMLAGIETWQEK
jgi:cytidylate kinase